MSIDINAVIAEVQDLVSSVETGDIEEVLRDVSSLVGAGADILASLKGGEHRATRADVDEKSKLAAGCDRLRAAVSGRRVAAVAMTADTTIDWQAVLKVVEQLIPVILSLFGV